MWWILLLQTAAFAEIKTDAIRLDGKIDLGKSSQCATGKAQLFLSEPLPEKQSPKQTLLYQVDVIPGGTFSFNLPAGNYEAYVMTSSECDGREKFQLVAGEKSKTITVSLAAKKGAKK